jgi:hypothetical protein
MGSDASGGWETYCMAGKHMCITNLIFNNYKNGQFSLKFLPVG